MEIKRLDFAWDAKYETVEMQPCEDGDYVLASDHDRVVGELGAEIAMLRRDAAAVDQQFRYHHTTKKGLVLYTRHYTETELYDARKYAEKISEALNQLMEPDAALKERSPHENR